MSISILHQALNEYRIPADAGGVASESAGSTAPLQACMRFVDGKPTAEDIAWIGKALAAYLGKGGEIPLARCLRLPTTHTGWRKLNRDRWLCKAAALIDSDGIWTGSQKLESEWTKFILRGPWKQWQDDDAPPDHATGLSEALFYATRLNRSQGLDAKQLCRIVGHVLQVKSR